MRPSHRRTIAVLSALTLATAAATTAVVLHLPQEDNDRAARITAFLQAPNTTATTRETTGQQREFTLEVHKITTEIAPGVNVEQWAYSFPGQKPTVPGPEIRVQQGDHVTIHFKNTHDQPHTVHLHGVARLAQQMDGLTDVMPGEEALYEFVATDPGTFAYHCHYQTYLHADMGMYGAIVVEPRDPSTKVWQSEHTLILDEWDSRQNPKAPVHHSEPNYFLVNGRSFPLIPDITIPEGQTSLLRMVNMGEELHSWHLHGNSFLVLAKDGYPLPQPERLDTLAIAPGERIDILVKGRDGSFPFHDHIVRDVTNNGIYPGGMHLMLKGGPALDPYGRLSTGPSMHAHTAQPTAEAHDHDHEHAGAPGIVPHGDPAHNDVYDHLPANSPIKVVNIRNFAFDQPELHVKVGTKVAWVNRDAVGHSVTAGQPGGAPGARAFDSSNEAKGLPSMLEQGEAWTYTFTKKGTFAYYCLPHTNMTAKVIVE
ncbi:multicopper oxidase domain-containing protein [Deinococcus maricopensis]|uniref:Multicopper oxidase type 3 n=1 Tax=Deinococcus maricopensis (strain DSM 21211 / LMG 22137 / NRRL B-23946 / LB-34) TaxID=709986 RepID=E8U4W0_DEIML|nr:multicopper oxidase domain-containing protein [Deinococcus maricopensis]ADV66099.1 multicopper oxidase type 3 [Deinococcus maricopensis DSM 21211]